MKGTLLECKETRSHDITLQSPQNHIQGQGVSNYLILSASLQISLTILLSVSEAGIELLNAGKMLFHSKMENVIFQFCSDFTAYKKWCNLEEIWQTNSLNLFTYFILCIKYSNTYIRFSTINMHSIIINIRATGHGSRCM